MRQNIVLKNNPIYAMRNCMVSKATHNASLKNGGTYKSTHISAITHHILLNLLPKKDYRHSPFIQWSDMQIIGFEYS